jgi:hypothetical protein
VAWVRPECFTHEDGTDILPPKRRYPTPHYVRLGKGFVFVKFLETYIMRVEGRENAGGTHQLLLISSCYSQFQIRSTSQKTLRLYYSDLWVNAM